MEGRTRRMKRIKRKVWKWNPLAEKQPKNWDPLPINKSSTRLKPLRDFDGDGVINAIDCQPLNPKKQGRFHEALRIRQLKAKYEGDDLVYGKKKKKFRKVSAREILNED